VFADVYEQYQSFIQPDKLVVIQGKIGQDNFTGGLAATAEKVFDITGAREAFGQSLHINISEQHEAQQWVEQLKTTLSPFKGGGLGLELTYQNSQASALFRLGEDWQVTPSDTLLNQLNNLPGQVAVTMRYNKSSP
jgi:DNA polymerase-3 subunit alpha